MTTRMIYRNQVVAVNRAARREPMPTSASMAAREALPSRPVQVSETGEILFGHPMPSNADNTALVYTDRGKQVAIVDTMPIPPTSPASPFRDGIPYTDPEDGLTYRVVKKIVVQEGWGTADFWLERYGLIELPDGFAYIKEWVERGWLDAAIQAGLPVKRYRCRDERKLYDHVMTVYSRKSSYHRGLKSKMREALKKIAPLFQ